MKHATRSMSAIEHIRYDVQVLIHSLKRKGVDVAWIEKGYRNHPLDQLYILQALGKKEK